MTVEILTIDSHITRGTVSALLVDDIVCCNTLELPWKHNNVDISCIPMGEYEIFLRKDSSRGYNLYEIKSVDGRTNIQIHVGNYLSQIKGCMLTGKVPELKDGKYWIPSSQDMYNKFMKMMNGRTEDKLIVMNRPCLP